MADIAVKRGEIREIEALLQDGTGAALPLGTALAVRFQARKSADTVLKIDRAAIVLDVPTGRVRVALSATDTDTTGSFKAEWRVTYAGGDVIVPESGYLSLRVQEDLAP